MHYIALAPLFSLAALFTELVANQRIDCGDILCNTFVSDKDLLKRNCIPKMIKLLEKAPDRNYTNGENIVCLEDMTNLSKKKPCAYYEDTTCDKAVRRKYQEQVGGVIELLRRPKLIGGWIW